MLQFRPQPGYAKSNDPYYNPQRDIAYLGPELIYRAVGAALDAADKEEWYKQLLNHYGLSKQALEQIGPTVVNLISHLHLDFNDALKSSGFDSLPIAAKVAFYVKMGQLLLASIHHGIRQVTDIHDPSPKSIQRLAKKIDETMKKYRL